MNKKLLMRKTISSFVIAFALSKRCVCVCVCSFGGIIAGAMIK